MLDITIVGVWASLASVTIALARWVDSVLTHEQKEALGRRLASFGSKVTGRAKGSGGVVKDPKGGGWLARLKAKLSGDYTRDIGNWFIFLFDRLYHRQHKASAWIWTWITVSFLSAAFAGRIMTDSLRQFQPLHITLAFGGVSALTVCAVLYSVRKSKDAAEGLATKSKDAARGRATLLMFLLAVASVGAQVYLIRTFFGSLAFVHGTFPWLITLIYVPVLGGVAAHTFGRGLHCVSPLRAIGSSIVVIVLFCVARPDQYRLFRAEVFASGTVMYVYLLLNVYADSFSLVETRYLLSRAVRSTWRGIIGYLVIDIGVSGAIFLAIPILSGRFGVFADAIRFKGPQPWLGILFWSTFATSGTFYLFLFSAVGLGALNLLLRALGRIANRLQLRLLQRIRWRLPLETQPMFCLAIAAILLMAIGFAILA